MFKQRSTPAQALQKAKHYCAYQERSHYDVKEKLYGYGLNRSEVEQLLSQLIEEDYLNEERFATGFARGHFKLKKWGRIKIEYGLKQKKVSSYNIKKAMKEIDDEEYEMVLLSIVTKKWNSLKAEQYINRMAKTSSYLLQKGYEPALVNKAISLIRQKNIK